MRAKGGVEKNVDSLLIFNTLDHFTGIPVDYRVKTAINHGTSSVLLRYKVARGRLFGG